MRRSPLLCLLFVAFAFLAGSAAVRAQVVSGQIEMVGFDGRYRPATWTPMLVHLQLEGAVSGNFQVRVTQRDQDGDLAVAVAQVTLTGGADPQPAWVYFIPQPVLGGLRADSAEALLRVLQVSVHDSNGRELAQLPLAPGAARPEDVDPEQDAVRSMPGKKLVLFVSDSPVNLTSEFDPTRLVGQSEGILPITVGNIDRLPDHILGYDAVDAVVWLGGDPGKLADAGSPRQRVLQEFVRRGGHLVIVAGERNWNQLTRFGEMLPVEIVDSAIKPDLSALSAVVTPRWDPEKRDAAGRRLANPWLNSDGRIAIRTARVNAKAGALIEGDQPENWIDWGNNVRTPWLVRKAYGYGCVSFVAQDLADRNLPAFGRAYLWNHVLGTKNDRLIIDPNPTAQQRWRTEGFLDIGYSLLAGLDLSRRSATLMAVALLFFVGYWVIAGPALFFVLRARGKAHLNWFAFGGVAVVATLFTLALVRLLLSGSPELRHVSVVRTGPSEPSAIVSSRIGMYVPRDGIVRTTLADAGDVARFTPLLAQFGRHDAWTSNDLLVKAPKAYILDAARAENDPAPPVLDLFFRTTQKQLSARWSGASNARIIGNVSALPGRTFLEGQISNVSGMPLRNVYLACRVSRIDYILYVRQWENNQTLDLAQLYAQGDNTSPADPQNPQRKVLSIAAGVSPDTGQFALGTVEQWVDFWYPALARQRLSGFKNNLEDFSATAPKSIPILSLFGRLPPRMSPGETRFEALRRGARDLDCSSALLAGGLVIIAQSQSDDQPLPMPLKVEGAPATGSGRVIYQFVLPVDRSATNVPPATRPVE